MTTPTLTQINQLIQTFGPVMRIHPQEKYLMDDPEPFLATGLNSLSFGLISDDDNKHYDTFHEDDLGTIPVSSGQTLRDAVARASKHPQAGDQRFRYWLKVSDTLTPGNMARAKAQVCVKRGVSDDTFDLQFWFFYGFNGPGKFRITAGNAVTEYIDLPKTGRHYGDWEHVTLRMVNGSTGWQIRSVYLSRHNLTIWVHELSDLHFVGQHPVIYVGRDSHAHYPSTGKQYYERPFSRDVGLGTAAVDLYDLTDDGGIQFDASTPAHYAIMHSDFTQHNVTPPAWSTFEGRWGQYEKIPYTAEIKAAGIHVYSYPYNTIESGPSGPLQHGADGLAAEWARANMGEGHGAVAWLCGNFYGGPHAQVAQCWGHGSSLGMFLYGSDGADGLKELWGSGDMGEGPGGLAWLAGDFNADGKAEIVQAWGHGSSLAMTMYGSDGHVGLKRLWRSEDMGEGPGAVAWLAGDFNGDGRTEIVQAWGHGSSLAMTMYGLNDGSGIPPAAWGLFGVGGLKRLWRSENMGEGPGAVTWLVGDFNGDGKAEIVQAWGTGSNVGMTLYGFDGHGGLTRLWRNQDMGEGHGAVAWLVGDFNGDGKAEIVQAWGNGAGLGMTMYGFGGGSGLKKLWKVDKMDDEGHGAVAWLVGELTPNNGLPQIVQAWGHGDGLGMTIYGFDAGSGGLKKQWKADTMDQGHGAVTWQVGNFTGRPQIVQGFGNGSRLGMILYTKATE